MRINKKLSNDGYCSRKGAHKLISDLRIQVNGVLATPGQWVEDHDLILIDGKLLVKKMSQYVLYYKPRGVLCTLDEEKDNSLFHLLPFKDYIFPVGRLDQDSEGLLLLTNDGDLAQKILSPLNHHEKEYLVTVNHPITSSFIQTMETGVDINIGVTDPCQVTRHSEIQFSIILTQGLNRQIRRMCRALGYEVLRLVRKRIITLHVGDLSPNSFRPLSTEELNTLNEHLK